MSYDKRKDHRHPMQPVDLDRHGVARFKPNAIVRYLLDHGGTLNELASMDFCRDDWNQFAQLIGYSVDGFAELSYATKRNKRKADKRVRKM